MFTSSSIIDNLNQSDGLEYKKLCRLLKITKKSDRDKLDIALTALEKLEIINKNKDDEYISSEKIVIILSQKLDVVAKAIALLSGGKTKKISTLKKIYLTMHGMEIKF